MKKLALLLFLITTTLIVSCSSDDDAPFVADETLIPGEWSLTDIRSENGRASATIGGLPVNGDYSVTGRDYTATATFTESTSENEPNRVTGSGGFILVASITVPLQDPIEVEQNVPELIGTGEWTVNGNTLSVTVQQETTLYEITSLTEQSMTLKIAIDEEVTVEIGAETVTASVTGDQFIELTKQ